VITTWLCFRYIKNDDLGVSPEELAAVAGDEAAAKEAV
jgi:hypothetical protein